MGSYEIVFPRWHYQMGLRVPFPSFSAPTCSYRGCASHFRLSCRSKAWRWHSSLHAAAAFATDSGQPRAAFKRCTCFCIMKMEASSWGCCCRCEVWQPMAPLLPAGLTKGVPSQLLLELLDPTFDSTVLGCSARPCPLEPLVFGPALCWSPSGSVPRVPSAARGRPCSPMPFPQTPPPSCLEHWPFALWGLQCSPMPFPPPQPFPCQPQASFPKVPPS